MSGIQTAQFINTLMCARGEKRLIASSLAFLDSVLYLSGCWIDATGFMFVPYHLRQVILVQVCVVLISGLFHYFITGHQKGTEKDYHRMCISMDVKSRLSSYSMSKWLYCQLFGSVKWEHCSGVWTICIFTFAGCWC